MCYITAAKMRLVAIFVALLMGHVAEAFERGELESAFVISRLDSRQVTCVAKHINSYTYMLPNYNLEEMVFPKGGFAVNFSDEWTLAPYGPEFNYSDVFLHGVLQHVFSDGRSEFQRLYTKDSGNVVVLSSNASVWYQETLKETGTLVQVDHRDKSTGVKFSRVMQCPRMPKDKQEEDQNCSTLSVERGTNFLNDGREWKEISNDFLNHRLRWSGLYDLYVRSHGRPGVFAKKKIATWIWLPHHESLRGKFTQLRDGKFCIEFKSFKDETNLLFTLRNLDENRLVASGRWLTIDRNRIGVEIDHLRAGRYQLTLRNITGSISEMNSCSSSNGLFNTDLMPPNMFTTFDSCTLYSSVRQYRTIFASGYLNASLTTGWNAKEWENVCHQLGVAKNVTERVPIKFCNPLWGCNFAKCPHRRMKRGKTLFQYPQPKMYVANANESTELCYRNSVNERGT